MFDKFISTTGDRFLYENETRYIFISFAVKEKINAQYLKETADAMMKRCPYFHVKKGIYNGLYCLEQVDDSIPIYENNGYIPTADERSRGLLITVAHYNNRVYICFNHSLTDAHGALRFTLSFAADYLRRVTGKNLGIPQELRPDSKIQIEEYENPYDHIIHQEYPFNLRSVNGFSVPEENIGTNSRRLRVSVPAKLILRMSKDAESNFASVLVMIMSQMISRVYTDIDTPIKIYCPVDMRGMLGCEKTLQHCCYGIHFVLPEKLRQMPYYEQLSCLKGMLMLQASEEYLVDRLEKQKISHEQLCENAKSIEDIKDKYNSVNYAEPMMSYLKTIDLGDIAPYIEDLDINIPVRGNTGIVIYSYCIGEKCVLNLCSNAKDDNVFDAFIDVLESLSIPFTVIDRDGFNSKDYHLKNWLGA